MAQEVRAVVWQSEGCWFDPTLGVSKCHWARRLTPNCSWRAGWYLAWQPIVWMGVNGWMRGINQTALWIKVLYKCSPFIMTDRSVKCSFPLMPILDVVIGVPVQFGVELGFLEFGEGGRNEQSGKLILAFWSLMWNMVNFRIHIF